MRTIDTSRGVKARIMQGRRGKAGVVYPKCQRRARALVALHDGPSSVPTVPTAPCDQKVDGSRTPGSHHPGFAPRAGLGPARRRILVASALGTSSTRDGPW